MQGGVDGRFSHSLGPQPRPPVLVRWFLVFLDQLPGKHRDVLTSLLVKQERQMRPTRHSTNNAAAVNLLYIYFFFEIPAGLFVAYRMREISFPSSSFELRPYLIRVDACDMQLGQRSRYNVDSVVRWPYHREQGSHRQTTAVDTR